MQARILKTEIYEKCWLHHCIDGLSFTNKPYDSRPIYSLRCSTAVADQHESHLSQVISPSRLRSKPSTPKRSSLKTSSPEELSLTRTDPYQMQQRFMRNSLTEDMDEFGKVGAETSYLQPKMHSDYDSSGEQCRLGS